MALGQMQLFSKALGRRVTFSFCLPDLDRFEPPYPALLQLHGASDDHTSWFMRSRLELYLVDLPLVVVTPDGALSGWTNWWMRGPGTRYEDYVMQDLLPACERYFPLRPGRWAIGGLSMGGFGALHLGLKYPDRFASIYAHSSAFFSEQARRQWFPDGTPEQVADTPRANAERAVSRNDRPAITFDCGLDDGLLEGNRAFHQHLERLGYPHEYLEFPGGHTWEYWDEHVQEALRRHMAVMGIAAT